MNSKSFLKLILTAFFICQFGYAQVSESTTVPAEVATVIASEKLPWPSLRSLYYDYKARQALKDKNPEIALEYNLRVLENEPYSVQTHSNLGIIFDYLQKKDESGQSFDLALELVERYKDQLSPADMFQIYYNIGLRYHTAKNTDRALEFYQKALDINPSSNETKHNIELLIQQQQQGGGGGEGKDKNQEGQGKQNEDPKDKDGKDKKDKDQEKDREQSSKYKPRPYQGDKLSEADVKKILGELSQQDKKIRANYNKKDRKEDKNAKDW
jgi:tetratricopeptide (TPR) repeat protein